MIITISISSGLQHFGVKAKYLGIPSYAHQINTGKEIYTITREGNIEDSVGRQLNPDSIIGSLNPQNEEADSVDAERDITRVEITHHTYLLNLLFNPLYNLFIIRIGRFNRKPLPWIASSSQTDKPRPLILDEALKLTDEFVHYYTIIMNGFRETDLRLMKNDKWPLRGYYNQRKL